MTIDEAMWVIVNFICDSLACERATVFAIDNFNGELWSKVAKGSNVTIKVPLGKGVAGYVANTANTLNIRDAYQDERFDPSNDKRTGFKTKTILAVPILNISGQVEGNQALTRRDPGNKQGA